LPFVFLAVVFTSVLLFARDRLKRILSPVPILVSVALVAVWYLYAILLYPAEFYAEFVGDQLTKKVARNPFEVPLAVPIYMGIGIASFFFLPAVLGVLGRGKKIADVPPVIKMLGLWVLIVPLAFSLGGFISERYLLPAVPVLAVLLALGFAKLDPSGRVLTQTSRILLGVMLAFAAAMLTLYTAIAFQLAPPGEALIVAGLSLAIIGVLAHSVWTGRRAAYLLPVSVVVVAAMSIFPLRHLVMPHPGDILAERLAAASIDPTRAFLMGDSELAAAVRLHAPRAEMFRETRDIDAVTMGSPCVVMSDEKRYITELYARGFNVEAVKGGWRILDPQRLIAATWNGRLADMRNERAATAVFATCPAS
jgi:hypothetical protein